MLIFRKIAIFDLRIFLQNCPGKCLKVMKQWRSLFEGRWPNLRVKTTLYERRLSNEDDLVLKRTFNGRWALMEYNLWWETTFDDRRSLIVDDLRLKTIFDGRWPTMEDALHWKTTLVGRRPTLEDKVGRLPLLKDYHRWNTLGKKPLMKDNLLWKTTFVGSRQL